MRVSPSLRSIALSHSHPYPRNPQQSLKLRPHFHQPRPFSSSLTPAQTLSASRILPYRAPDLFNIIADIASYPAFIPYLRSSHITSHSSPDPEHNKTWPRTASLDVGYGPYTESFTSSVYCVPYTVLEAVVGDASPTIPDAQLKHYIQSSDSSSPAQPPPKAPSSDFIQSLLTRWSFREFPFKPSPPDGQSPEEGSANAASTHARTEVGLHIEVKFASLAYAALSQAAAPKVAEMMVEVFEKRAREVLGEGHEDNVIQGGRGKGGGTQH